MKNGKCPAGQYYCYTNKECKPIPAGFMVDPQGMLRKENGASTVKEEGLRDWFGKSKSKDGKSGWVNVVTGGTCASDEPGEGTPKCVSSAKRASMSKAERLSAQRRKKKADPGQQQKSGAAKPTYVSTDKPKKKMTESEEKRYCTKCKKMETRSQCSYGPEVWDKMTIEKFSEAKKDHEYSMARSQLSTVMNAAKRLKKKMAKGEGEVEAWVQSKITKAADYLDSAADYVDSGEMNEAADKPGKGSGKKDACYHKVKSRYSVWPSAYASGALVKCRKKGADNWGNKTEEKATCSQTKKGKECPIHGIEQCPLEVDEAKKCWPGYEKKGTQKLFGKTYNRCVKKEGYAPGDVDQRVGAVTAISQSERDAAKARLLAKVKAKREAMKKEDVDLTDAYGETFATIVDIVKPEPIKTVESPNEWYEYDIEAMTEAVRIPAKTGNIILVTLSWRGKFYMIKMFFPQISKPSRSDVQAQIDKVYPGARVNSYYISDVKPGEQFLQTEDIDLEEGMTLKDFKSNRRKLQRREASADAKKRGHVGKEWYNSGRTYSPDEAKRMRSNLDADERSTRHRSAVDPEGDDSDYSADKTKNPKKLRKQAAMGEDWQSVNRKDKTDGLSQKAVDAYRKENPGSKLKTAVTKDPSELKKGSKDANRRKSFCSRMKGMKKNLTSAETARDPDSRINKALRRWNCN